MKWPRTRIERMEYALWILVLLHLGTPSSISKLLIDAAKAIMP